MITPLARRTGKGGQGDRDAGPAQRRPSTPGAGLGSDRFGSELSKAGE